MTPQSIPTDAAVDSVSLGRHDEPFSVVGPWKDDVTAARQVVFTAVHSGHDLRDEIRERMVLDEQVRFREEDPFTDAIGADRSWCSTCTPTTTGATAGTHPPPRRTRTRT